jgi:hypothetical protein
VNGNGARFRLRVLERTTPTPNTGESAQVAGAALGWTELATSLSAQGGVPLTLELEISGTSGALQGIVDDVRLWRSGSGACVVP